MAFNLREFLGLGIEKVVDAVGNTVDKIVTNKEEQEELKNETNKLLLDYQKATEIELTKRLEVDMSSDSWLSKNIRPLSIVYTTIIISILTFLHGNIGTFSIDTAYVALFQSLLLMQYTFYFGSRGIEKIIQQINKGKELNLKDK